MSPEFLSLAIIHLLAVISPGSDFVVVVKESLGLGKKAGIITALGVGCGIMLHVSYTLLGIGLLVQQSVMLFNILKWLAALYLLYLGLKAITAKAAPNNPDNLRISCNSKSNLQSFMIGFTTNGLNPKAMMFIVSLFSLVISPNTSLPIQISYGIYMVIVTAAWFSLVAILLNHKQVKAKFNSLGHWLDRIMGLALITLSVKLMLDR